MTNHRARKAQNYLKRQRSKEKSQVDDSTTSMKIGYWNANGILAGDKLEQISTCLKEEDLDVLCVAETHLREGHQVDLSIFEEYRVITNERGYGDKLGGGLLTLVKSSITHLVWTPKDDEYPDTYKEKSWVLIREGGAKIGLGFVYMAAQVIGTEEFKEWNRKLYCSLQKDLDKLQADGYDCIIVGDYNGHVGNGIDGIPGNLPGINSNGALMLEFIQLNKLKMINADQTRTMGLFTRSSGGSSTILDYALATKGADKMITKMEIDEVGDLLDGSDHAAVVLEIRLSKQPGRNEPADEVEQGLRIPGNTDYVEYKNKVDELLKDISWEVLTVDDKCKALQSTIIQAGAVIFGNKTGRGRVKRKPKIPKSLKSLRSKKRHQERIVKKLSIAKARKIALNLKWRNRDARELKDRMEVLQRTKEMLVEKDLEYKLRRRRRLREINKMGSKAFWRLVKRLEKQNSNIKAVEDEHGELATDRSIVEEIVLQELSKIFKGQRSKIFESKGEQLVAAAYTMHHKDQKDWVGPIEDADRHEQEVCQPVSLNQVMDLVAKHKDSRASGIDGIPTRLFKNASGMFYEMMTDMINDCLESGTSPQCLNTGRMTLIDKKEPSLQVIVYCVVNKLGTKFWMGPYLC